MKKISILFICFFLYLSASAQSHYKSQAVDSLPKPSFVVKWAPLCIIDIDPTMQMGLEYLPGSKWSIQQEFGYGRFGYSGMFSPDEDEQQKEVWRSRTEARVYLNNHRPKATGPYMAFEMLYKRVNYKSDEQIGRNCENGPCEYKETVQNKLFKDVTGFHIKFGVQAPIGKRLALDVYMGIGGRNVVVKATNKELEEYWKEYSRSFFANPSRPGSYGLVSGNLGFKIGYFIYR